MRGLPRTAPAGGGGRARERVSLLTGTRLRGRLFGAVRAAGDSARAGSARERRSPPLAAAQRRGGRYTLAMESNACGATSRGARTHARSGEASSPCRIGTARGAAGVGGLDGPCCSDAGNERANAPSGCGHGAGASSVSMRQGSRMGGATTDLPSSLHIGTAALAGALTSMATATTASSAKRFAAAARGSAENQRGTARIACCMGREPGESTHGFRILNPGSRDNSGLGPLIPASRFLCLHCAT
jgi:hypothetical protein